MFARVRISIEPPREGKANRAHGPWPLGTVNMDATAIKVGQTMRGSIRSAFRPSDLSIRSLLIACFVLIVLLMIAADAVAIWQYWQIEALAQRVRKTDQISDAVVRIHLDVYSFRDKIVALASGQDVSQFSSEAAEIRR